MKSIKNQEKGGTVEAHLQMALVALSSLWSHIGELYKGARGKEECDQLRSKLTLLEGENQKMRTESNDDKNAQINQLEERLKLEKKSKREQENEVKEQNNHK